MLGYIIEGEWDVSKKNKILNFLNYKEANFLLTNNLIVNSPKINFYLNFQAILKKKKDRKKSKKKALIKSNEVMILAFSPEMFREMSFNKKSTEIELKGYIIYFFRKNKKRYILLKKNINPELTNLQSIFKTQLRKHTNNSYCEYNYLNQETDLKIEFNFEKNTFKVKVNNSECISTDIDKNIFIENKVSLTFSGFSTYSAPINIQLNSLQIEKFAVPFLQEEIFHANLNNFISAYTQFDDKYNLENNVGNILLTSAKIMKTFKTTQDLLDLMASRSSKLEKIFEENSKKKENDEENIFFDNPKMFKKMENHMSTVQKMVDYNQNLNKSFSDLENNFGGIQKLFEFENRISKLESVADGLDEMIKVYQNEVFLNNLENFENFARSDEFIKNYKIAKRIRNRIRESLEVSTSLKVIAGVIFFLVLFLIFCIVRKINQSIKTQVF